MDPSRNMSKYRNLFTGERCFPPLVRILLFSKYIHRIAVVPNVFSFIFEIILSFGITCNLEILITALTFIKFPLLNLYQLFYFWLVNFLVNTGFLLIISCLFWFARNYCPYSAKPCKLGCLFTNFPALKPSPTSEWFFVFSFLDSLVSNRQKRHHISSLGE